MSPKNVRNQSAVQQWFFYLCLIGLPDSLDSPDLPTDLISRPVVGGLNLVPPEDIHPSHFQHHDATYIFVTSDWFVQKDRESLVFNKVNQTTVNWAQLSNKYRANDTDMLPGSYPHRKYMVCMV